MSVEVEEQCIREWLEAEESTDEVSETAKITYTRDFVLSFKDLDICKGFPCGLKLSISSSECNDVFRSTCERQGIHGSIPWYGIKDTVYDFRPSGRHCEDPTQGSWQNPESNGTLTSGGFSIVSGCTEGVLGPKIRDGGCIKLNKSDNPYRPPHTYKRVSVAADIGFDTSMRKQSDKHTVSGGGQHETYKLDDYFIVKSTKNASTSSDKRVSDNLGSFSRSLEVCFTQENRLASIPDDGKGFAPWLPEEKQPFCSDISERRSEPTSSSLASTTSKGLEKHTDCFKPAMNWGILMPSSPEQTGLSDEADLAVQRVLVDRTTGTDISKPHVFHIPILDGSVVTSIIDGNGATGMYHHGVDSKNYVDPIESDKTEKKPSDFDETWVEMLSISQITQELKLTDEGIDLKVKMDHPTSSKGSDFELEPDLALEKKSKLSPVAHCDEIGDLQNEICLPDEDSLITIDDLLAPYRQMNPLKARHSMIPFIDPMGLTSYQNKKSQHYGLSSGHSQKLRRPSFHLSDSEQEHRNTQAKLVGSQHPASCLMLQHPQTNLPLQVPAFSDSINQMACCTQDINPMHFIPVIHQHTSYQAFGMPNLGINRSFQNQWEAYQTHSYAKWQG